MNVVTKTITLGDGRTITLETGKLAKQADGAVMVTMGKTMLLATVCSAQDAVPGTDFMPLTVEYKEKFASNGRFPGGFTRREGRSSDYEILVSRLVDRALRPLFPDDYHAETFVNVTLYSADGEDMVFATVSVLDAAGNPCPNAAPHVRFQTEGGSLVIVAADGGNAASLEPFHTPECTLFSGMAVIYLRSTGSLGKTVLRAESDGLCSTELVFNAKNICLTAGIRKKMTAR